MSGAMLSRQEWYSESLYDETPWPPRYSLAAKAIGAPNTPRVPHDVQLPFEATTGILKIGDIVTNQHGLPIGVAISIDHSNQSVTVMTQGLVNLPARRAGKQSALNLQAAIYALTVQPIMDTMKEIGKTFTHLSQAVKSDYTLFPPPRKDETVKERALRLKKQPHSMAQDPHDFHFDHRGRRRY